MEIAPGVHRVEDVTGSNVVLLTGDQMAVIDAGIPGNGDAIVSYIRKLGRSPRDLQWIIVTHHHFDHSGSAWELRELTGAKVVAHRSETEPTPDGKLLLRKGGEGEPPPSWYRWILARSGGGRRPEIVFHDIEVQMAVEDGETLDCLGGLRIIHTPGHTPGSISPLLADPQVIFLGDSALNNVDRLSRPLTWDRAKRRQLDESLRGLRDLEAAFACFGHGPPLTDQVMEKVRGMTDRPYDMPTWRIALKNWQTLQRFRASTQRKGHWEGGKSD